VQQLIYTVLRCSVVLVVMFSSASCVSVSSVSGVSSVSSVNSVNVGPVLDLFRAVLSPLTATAKLKMNVKIDGDLSMPQVRTLRYTYSLPCRA